MIHLSPVDFGLIALYFLALLSLGFLLPKNPQSTTEYLLAGRRLTLPLFVLTLVSTWYGATMGVVELAFSYGIVNWLTQGFFWYLSYLFFAFFLAKKVRQSGFFTLPDQLEHFYNKEARFMGAVLNFIMLSPAPYILSLGVIFGLLFDIPAYVGVGISLVVMFFYTLRGGFRAVIHTDILQFFLMILGAILLLVFSVLQFGGFEFLRQSLPENHLTITGGWTMQMIFVWGFLAMWTLVDPNFYQRCYASRDASIPKKGILISLLFWMVFDLCTTGIGLYAMASMPDLDPKTALPVYAAGVLPPVLLGIFFAGLLASIMSTIDSFSFAGAINISHDIYKNIFKKDATDAQVITITRWALLVSFCLAAVLALTFESIIWMIYTLGTVGVSALLFPLLYGFFGPKQKPKNAAFLSMIMAVFVSFFWLLHGYLHLDEWGFPQYAFGLEPMYPGLFASVIVFFGGGRVRKERWRMLTQS
jgi:SSS family solute:Na+ symporter